MNQSFEWYYFDLHSDDGYDFVFTLHSHPFMTQFAVSIFDIFIYKDNRLLEHCFFTKPVNSIQKDKEAFKIYFDEDNYILYDKKQIRVQAKGPEISFDLNFINLLEDAETFKYDLLTGQNRADSFIWKLHAPICKADANLRINNREYRLNGQGYHDYNGGDVFLKKELNGWRWSKFYFRDKLAIIGEIIPRKGEPKNILVIASEKGLEWSEDFRLFRSAEKITVQSEIINFEFAQVKCRQLDDIRFLSINPPKLLRFPAKIFEIITAVFLQYRFLNPLSKILTNVRYTRQRLLGQINNDKLITVFQEEIIF